MYVSNEQRSPAGCIGGQTGTIIHFQVLNTHAYAPTYTVLFFRATFAVSWNLETNPRAVELRRVQMRRLHSPIGSSTTQLQF